MADVERLPIPCQRNLGSGLGIVVGRTFDSVRDLVGEGGGREEGPGLGVNVEDSYRLFQLVDDVYPE